MLKESRYLTIIIALCSGKLAYATGPTIDNFNTYETNFTTQQWAEINGSALGASMAQGGLQVKVCGYHLPAGSQNRANLVAAITAYNNIPGVSINISTNFLETSGHLASVDSGTYSNPVGHLFVDFDPTIAAGAAASMGLGDDDGDGIYDRARLKISPTTFSHGPTTVSHAVSVGVFMHELGHAFGFSHPDSATDISLGKYQRVTIHGNKKNQNDFRGDHISALTIAKLRITYPDSNLGNLNTDELTVHNSLQRSAEANSNIAEFGMAKTYTRELMSGKPLTSYINDIKMKWDTSLSTFISCETDDYSHWFGQWSETSTNTSSKNYNVAFEISTVPQPGANQWSRLTTRVFSTYTAGQTEFRQHSWDKNFTISAAQAGTPTGGPTSMVRRKFRFLADADTQVNERREDNNQVMFNVCLYPTGSACNADCLQDWQDPIEFTPILTQLDSESDE